MSSVSPTYEKVCAAMVKAMDPGLSLDGPELSHMAQSIARRMAPSVDDAQTIVIELDRELIGSYRLAGEPFGNSPEARWRWFFDGVDA